VTNPTRVFTVGILIGCLLGCSSPTVSKDGSAGSLSFGTQTLGGASFQSIGFGTTDQAGFFHLMKSGGLDPLILEPGDYVFTLESVGPQIQFSEEYLNAELSPLKATWSAESTSLDLKAPEELISAIAE
jgi:hypothetical protein